MTLPLGFDLAQLLWSALIPLVFFLLLRHKKRLQELLGKALAAYCLAWVTYEIVRPAAFPRARDGWLVLGVKTFVVFLLLELAWGKIHPARDEDAPSSLVLALYIALALVSFIGVVLSFLGRV
jgi:hypothetical protein